MDFYQNFFFHHLGCFVDYAGKMWSHCRFFILRFEMRNNSFRNEIDELHSSNFS